MKHKYVLIACVLMVLLLSSCSSDNQQKSLSKTKQGAENTTITSAKSLPEDDIALAKVKGTTISKYDVERTLVRMFGENQSRLFEAQDKQKALESLVASRAMALDVEKQLTELERQELEKDIRAHKEKLLVNKYLKKHTNVTPVTDKMIEDYYTKHQERFGGKKERVYELVFTNRTLNTVERDKVISILNTLKTKTSWKNTLAKKQAGRYGLVYKSGNTQESVLAPELRDVMAQLKVKDPAQVIFLKGRPYMMRLVSEKSKEPMPLAQVKQQIRQQLGTVQLKKAVQQAKEKILKNAEIEYIKPSIQVAESK